MDNFQHSTMVRERHKIRSSSSLPMLHPSFYRRTNPDDFHPHNGTPFQLDNQQRSSCISLYKHLHLQPSLPIALIDDFKPPGYPIPMYLLRRANINKREDCDNLSSCSPCCSIVSSLYMTTAIIPMNIQ